MEIKGRNLLNGLPENIEISSVEIREALGDALSSVIDAVKVTLEKPHQSWLRILLTRGLC